MTMTEPRRATTIEVYEVAMESVDHRTVGELKRRLAAFDRPGTQLVLDLRRVDFMDSSGLGALLATLRRLAASGGDLKVCCLTPAVHVLFELVRVHRVFEVLRSREEALAACEG